MSTVAISGLAAGTVTASGDLAVFVDVSDTSQSPNGTTKKITFTNLFAAIPVAVGMGSTLSVAGALTLSSTSAVHQAGGRNFMLADATRLFFYSGSGGVFVNDSTNTFSNLMLTDAGALSVRAGLAITGALSGVTTIAASGTVTLTATGTSIAASGDITVATQKRIALNAGATIWLAEEGTPGNSSWIGPAGGRIGINLNSTFIATFTETSANFGSNNVTVVTGASTTTRAGLNIPHGAAPTSPVNGDMWTTTAGAFIRINGVTKTFTLI